MRERRLLVLASKPMGLAPSQRFRLEQWAPRLLSEHGIVLDFAPFESPALAQLLYEPGHVLAKALLTLRDYFRRSSVLVRARNYDGIVIHREGALIGPAIYESFLASLGKPIIFDFDDAIWSPVQARTNGPFGHLHFYRKTSTLCRLATVVTTGNDFLASYARARNPSVFVVPSSIELAEYPVAPDPAEDGKFIVCWTGSTSTLIHFELARPTLERLAKELPLVVKVICSKPPDKPIAGAEMRFVRWAADSEGCDAGDCHVGIMPLPHDEISRGKCAMKALQFMAAGRPVVVSPVGANVEIVRSGENGLLANTEDEWLDALKQLARSPDLRARLGGNARRTVEQGYSSHISADRFAAAVARLDLAPGGR